MWTDAASRWTDATRRWVDTASRLVHLRCCTDAARRWTETACCFERIPLAGCRVIVALLLAGVAQVHALSTDGDQPISIQADQAEHDDAEHITIYRGNVVIDQGTLHITGDTVTIHFNAQGQVTKITAVGTPAYLRQLPDGDTSPRKAWAKQMEHFPERDLTVLAGDARYEKNGSRVEADRLVYDSLNARFEALTEPADEAVEDGQATGTKPGRVRIRIQPKKSPTQ